MYDFFKRYITDDGLFYSALIILIGIASFGLGRWSVADVSLNATQPAAIILNEQIAPVPRAAEEGAETPSSAAPVTPATAGKYVGSKNGSKYHLPYCPGAKQMKEENKVWFASKEEAEAAGYAPAANCKGI